MLYSIRMRAAQGGAHENGGKHISGAERLLKGEFIEAAVRGMIERAQNHSRGKADFINIKIESVEQTDVENIALLSIESLMANSVKEAQAQATRILRENAIAPKAILAAFNALISLKENMRGAILMDALSGKRIDKYGGRGVRVSRMDVENEAEFLKSLQRHDGGAHLREAVVLATKVALAPGIVGELCWSDDPEYTTGYVCGGGKYHRIASLKEFGDERGGRVFFVVPGTDVEKLVQYLEKQPVLVRGS